MCRHRSPPGVTYDHHIRHCHRDRAVTLCGTYSMPSDLSYWLISVPLHDGDPATVLDDVRRATGGNTTCGGWAIPELKVGF